MARDMRTTPDFILSQPRLHFAAHIRNVTPSAVSVPIEPVRGAPELPEEAYRRLIERNRARVSLGNAASEVIIDAPRLPAALPGPGEDISRAW